MHEFKNFGIESVSPSFVGDKIKMTKVLNKKIVVHGFKLDKSKFTEKGNGNCLCLQVKVDNEDRIIFTGSSNLMLLIQKVPKENFPFSTTIIKDDNDRYQFT